jgi:hypothetical protein
VLVGARDRTRDQARDDTVALLLAVGLSAYFLWFTRDWVLLVADRWSVPAVWLFGVATGLAFVRWRLGRLPALAFVAVTAVATAAVIDVTLVATEALRDWHLYLRAAERWLTDRPVYLDHLLTSIPADPKDYPFLYPPMTLPLFAGFALLPGPVADALLVGGSIVASCGAFRLFGLAPRWWAVFIAWTPIFLGIYVGNVIVPILLLFAIGPYVGGALVVEAVFKVYAGVPALWLVRQRRLAELAAGAGFLAAWALVTLPVTGLGLWREWMTGLLWVQRSQPLLPELLSYLGLARFLPQGLAWGLAALAVVAAARVAGRASLARFGVATVVASPSLYLHGGTWALPALLMLRPALAWFAFGLMSFVPATPFWAAIGLMVASWAVPVLARRPGDAADPDPLDPLGGADGPWPGRSGGDAVESASDARPSRPASP